MDPILYNAAFSGEISFLKTLTADEKTMYFSQLTPMNNTLLHVSAEFKQAKFFKEVCSKSDHSLIWQPNSKLETPLHVAARAGCLEIVRFLIQQEPVFIDADGRRRNLIRKKNKDGDTALHCAVRSARSDVVSLLLEIDPELSSFSNYADESPLYLAVLSHYPAESMIKFIRSSSPSFSHMGPRGLTALHEAVCCNASRGVEELVKKRPEMMKEADEILGRTPFHFAAFQGAAESVKILMKYDANPSAAYLLDHDGNSAVHIAAIEGQVNVMKELLVKCPDIFELTNKKGQTALHVAVLNGKRNIVDYVLKNRRLGGLLNEPDEDGNTPLHLAVCFDYEEIVVLLARDLRVDIKAKNKEFKSACDIFSSCFQKDVFKRLRIRSLLSGGCLAEYSQHYCRDVRKEWMNRKPGLKPLLVGKQEYSEQIEESQRKFPDIYLVVATLVITISFTAVFAELRGYYNEGKSSFFFLYYLFSTLSFISSIGVISFQTITALNGNIRHKYGRLQESMLLAAVHSLALAFCCGVYVTFNAGISVALFLIIIVVFFSFAAQLCH